MLQSRPFSVAEVCKSALEMVRHLASKKRLELSLLCEGHPPMLLGDAQRLKQVLIKYLGCLLASALV